MTDLRQAAQQALEALHEFGYHGSSPRWERTSNALKAALAQPEQEPTPWRDMIVVSLVREGINKHKARELADYFAAQPEPPLEWEWINNILHEYGLQAIDFVSDWRAAQRPWQGLTDEEYQEILKQHDGAGLLAFYNLVEAKLKEKNT